MLHEQSEHSSTPVCQIAIIEAFAGLEDPRRRAGQRHTLPLCLALFTLAMPQGGQAPWGLAAGNKGFASYGDWISSYQDQLIDLFKPPKNRLPSYSTIRRALLHLNYEEYSTRLARFFEVQPLTGETIGLVVLVLRGSYPIVDDNPLFRLPSSNYVSQYLHCGTGVDFSFIWSWCQNQRALKQYLRWFKNWLSRELFSRNDTIYTQKKLVNWSSRFGNDYIAALKGNQPGLFQDVTTKFIPEFSYEQINKGSLRVVARI